MKKLIGILALAAAFAVPAAGSGTAQGETVQSKSAKNAKAAKETVVRRELGQPLPSSAFAHHPSYDVYVNGEYAGSDPDPRVRWTIRREYCEQRADGC